MNERIRELYLKAVERNWAYDSEFKAVEKFTELILREFAYDCMDVTDMSHHIEFVAKKWGVEL